MSSQGAVRREVWDRRWRGMEDMLEAERSREEALAKEHMVGTAVTGTYVPVQSNFTYLQVFSAGARQLILDLWTVMGLKIKMHHVCSVLHVT